ncbi:hypothetical protein [Natronolimnohabitans innermongolicus]|uniref:DZANK-type domain-containing protein n=1 Tax=Natronolimnohabitans innermongolicus JCM 12255 TaxID=1227499 RepID=L9X1P4_9EURY|nr:hypothetical protein [Natronolimnohabitans innermongolicus]ELY55512.1 hypothetical protein C493_11132 [Natronolimnohabitans innermongolicus JCM 12255]
MPGTYRCESCSAHFKGSRMQCGVCGTAGTETDRETCLSCGVSLTDSKHQQCPRCGSTEVERLERG